MRRIDSVKNSLVADLRAAQTAKGREELSAYLAEGPHLLREAVNSGIAPIAVLAEDGFADSALLQRLQDAGADVVSAPKRCIEAAGDTKTPQGVLALIPLPPPADPMSMRRCIALDGVQDPGNVGTIMRLCGAAGWDGVLLSPSSADAFAPKTVRAAMGASFFVPVVRAELAPLLMAMGEQGVSILAADLSGDDFFARPDLGACALVIGAEGQGLSPQVRACATHVFRLPMPGRAESLNAAMAAAVMVYDFLRRDA